MLAVWEELFEKNGLKHYTKTFEQLTLKGIRMSTDFMDDEDEIAVGSSKMGGRPDLPEGIDWPMWKDGPLSFLGQVNLEELVLFSYAQILPKKGLLYFFYDASQQTWGYDPADAGSWRVIYSPLAPGGCSRRELPEALSEEMRFDPCKVSWSEVLTLPPSCSIAVDKLGMTLGETDAYEAILEEVNQAGAGDALHQLLGHPAAVQGDMQVECQLVSNGLYCGDSSGYDDPRANELRAGAEAWRLLLQVDSDDQAEMMWGDCGRVFFWIHKDDLVNAQFDNTWMVLQCA